MKSVAVFPGSFDPFTVGHEAIVRRALPLFDTIVIAIGINSLKSGIFSLENRISMITKVFENESGIKVDSYEGLTIDYCRKVDSKHIIRGLRTSADFEFERAIAQVNRVMAPEVESLFFLSSPEHSAINSTIVREILRFNGDASQFVPEGINLADYM